jgi:CheY-like chemotaxis protein
MNTTAHTLEQDVLAEPRPAPAMPPPGLRVMCVDDNEDAADSLGCLLSMVGCEVSVAHDAPSALAAVGDARPQVCVLDISMPGMDGCELARRLRGGPGGGEMLLIALTALGDYHSIQRIADAGFDLYFTKPVESRDLYAAFNNYVLNGRP